MKQHMSYLASDLELHQELTRLDKKLMDMSKLLMQKAIVAFFELSHLLYMVLDERGKMVLANPAWTKMLGWTPENLLGRTLMSFVHPEDRAKSADAFKEVMKTGLITGFRNRARTTRGGFCELEWYATSSETEDFVYVIAKPGPDNLPMGFRKRQGQEVEDRLVLSRHIRGLPTSMLKEAMLAFFEMSPLLFMICSTDGRIMLVNPAWTRYLGWRLNEMLEKPLFEFYPPG